MKRSFLGTSMSVAVIAMLLAFTASAQTVFLDENFDSVAGGTTPPAGWTKFISGTGAAEWRFDDVSGVAPTGGGFAGGQASISSDFAGGSGHDATLRSPDFDLSGATGNVFMDWDHYARMLGGTTLTVSVFDGAVYNTVFTQTGTPDVGSPTSPVAESFDITALAGGASNCNVEFNYVSGFDWWWYVDNVTVYEPAVLPGQAPRPGMAVFDINNATNANTAGVASGDNGPYKTTITPGTTMTMSWEGEAFYPVSCFYGNLNPSSATYPGGIGQTDVGGPGLDANGYPLNIGVFADGIGFAGMPGELALDAFFYCNAAGTGGLTLPFPSFGVAPGTTLTTFQCTMSSSAAPFFYLSNAVEVVTN